jgi:hypothetical protein
MIGWHKVRLVVQPCELGNITAKLTSKKVVVLTALPKNQPPKNPLL